jgi:uncharacterized membrane protein
MNPPAPEADKDLAVPIGMLLRAGVIASAVVLLLGGAVHLYRHGREPVPKRKMFKPEPPEFSHPAPILRAALGGSGRATIQLGVLLLIATPVMRVAFSVYGFARQRDRAYVVMTLIVLAVLLLGLLGGPVGR